MTDLLIGDYTPYNYSITDFDTCVNKDLRPGFEGHRTVTFSWDLHVHPANGML